MQNSNLRFSAIIDLSLIDVNGVSNPDYRKITLEDTTDYASLSVPLNQLKGYFIVKDPLGNYVHLGNATNPDIVQSTSRVFDDILIPLDSYGNPIQGKYVFQMFVVRTVLDVSTTYNTQEVVVNVCNKNDIGEVSLVFDCNKSLATGRDITKYPSNATVNRLLTLSPPVGSKYTDGSDAPNFVTSGLIVQSNSLWTQTWQLLLRATINIVSQVSVLQVTIKDSVEKREDARAVCNINICSLMKCYDKRILQLEQRASRVGGISNDYIIGEEMMKLTNLYIMLQGARECGNITKASDYYNQLKEILLCDCGCSDSGMPEYVYPLVNPQEGITVVEGSQYVSVTANTVGNITTYTVAISSTLANLISLVKTYAVTSSDSTIDVTTTTTGTSVVFDIKVNINEVDDLMGALIDASGFSTETTLTGIVQDLVDKAKEGGLPPVAEPDNAIIPENGEAIVLVTANDFYSSNVVVTITTPPNNGSATVGLDGKTITYNPNADWSGTDVLTYTITDAEGRTSSATLTIIVNTQSAETCAVISAQFVASLSAQSGAIRVTLTNITNYLTNIPTSNNYVIEVRNASNAILFTYNVVGRNDSLGQIFTIPDTPDNSWNNIRISQTVVSENNVGSTCGTTTSENVYNMPDVSTSIFAGVTVTCLGVTNADPDQVIMQALVDKACSANNNTINVAILSGVNNGDDSTVLNLEDYISIPSGWYLAPTLNGTLPPTYWNMPKTDECPVDANLQVDPSSIGQSVYSVNASNNPNGSAFKTQNIHGAFYCFLTNGLASRRVNILIVNNQYKSWVTDDFSSGDEADVFSGTGNVIGAGGACRRLWKIENQSLKVKWVIKNLYKDTAVFVRLNLPITLTPPQIIPNTFILNCGIYSIVADSLPVGNGNLGGQLCYTYDSSGNYIQLYLIDNTDNKIVTNFLATSSEEYQQLTAEIDIPLPNIIS